MGAIRQAAATKVIGSNLIIRNRAVKWRDGYKSKEKDTGKIHVEYDHSRMGGVRVCYVGFSLIKL